MTLLSPKAVAARLGVSPLTVLRLVDDGSLPAVAVHRFSAQRRFLRFRAESVEEFISRREQRPRRPEAA